MSLRRCCLFALLLATPNLVRADAAVWEAVREGRALVILRHAYAPGIGDPEYFRLEDCATQRNLNAQGREQSARWGDFFRTQGLASATVYTSRWCRAVDTAEGFCLGRVQRLAELDSFFQDRGQEDAQTQALRRMIAGLPAGVPVIMVSHQVNISALTGEFTRSGDAMVLALPLANPPEVLARVPAPTR
ncbi:MAG: histidine phosphatase family protein [Halopseudomonas sp.]